MVHAQTLADDLADRRDLFRSQAADWNCGYVDLETEWIDPQLLTGYDPEALAREGWLPLHHDDEGYVVVATSVEPTPERVAMIEEAVGAPVCVAVTSDWDLDAAIERAYRYPAAEGRKRRGWVVAAFASLLLVASVATATGPTLVTVGVLTSAGFLLGVGAVAALRLRAGAGEPTDDDLHAFLHHLRHPATLAREAGILHAPGVLLRTGGGPAALLLTPPLYALFAAALVLPAERLVPAWLVAIVLASLLVGNALLSYVELLDAFKQRRGTPVGPALLRPLRWLLQSAAAYRTLWRLLT
ncbi:hypothetical protein [Asanoa iriomotensis]|uniref:Type II secretion system protein GspE N-terminal domain-containing protein n=1 Tax=Asanoa iriomotensis TaxID=234613 RepID=A0ABQ4C8D9_9ACTN|nr:hypothetical protein [Asanoa iriomotensis]GIF59004.1 hypothetical protein Air01nite_50990 [Asanoa iriomotensis]